MCHGHYLRQGGGYAIRSVTRFVCYVVSLSVCVVCAVLLTQIITSDKGGGTCICDCPACLSVCLSVTVCLSVSKITQKRVHGFG